MHVSPEYFTTLGITITHGRGFDAGEARAESHVAVVSASAAQALWPGGNALGQTFRMWLPPEPPADAITRTELYSTKDVEEKSWNVVVIGVASDIANEMVYQGRHVPHLYLPTASGAPHARSLLVRGRSVVEAREALQGVLRGIDANPLAFEALPLEEAISLQMYPLTVASWIGMLLSAVALALSVSGLYGVMTYGISHRMKEIGIRMALGASSRAIVRLVLSQSGRLVAIGAAIGGTLSFSALAAHAGDDRPEERVDPRPGRIRGGRDRARCGRRSRCVSAVAESDAESIRQRCCGGCDAESHRRSGDPVATSPHESQRDGQRSRGSSTHACSGSPVSPASDQASTPRPRTPAGWPRRPVWRRSTGRRRPTSAPRSSAPA